MGTKNVYCEVSKTHAEAVERVQQSTPNLSDTAQIFKAFADETRLKIAYALTLEKELCVCEVAQTIGSSVATASHHLRYLRNHALAKSERKGRKVYYSLKDYHVFELVTIAFEHASENLKFQIVN